MCQKKSNHCKKCIGSERNFESSLTNMHVYGPLRMVKNKGRDIKS